MKKFLCLILALLTIFTVSCRASGNIEYTENDSYDSSQSDSTELNEYIDTYEYICNMCPFSTHLKTYESFFSGLEMLDSSESWVHPYMNLDERNKIFIEFLANKEKIELPRINGEILPLYYENSYSIDYFCHLIKIPHIMYQCSYNGKWVRFEAMYPTIVRDNLDISSELPADEILRRIFPNAVNIDNFEEKDTYYKNVYMRTIQLKDEAVSAIVYEYDTDDRVQVSLYTNGWWLSILSYSDTLTDEFWSSFSFS